MYFFQTVSFRYVNKNPSIGKSWVFTVRIPEKWKGCAEYGRHLVEGISQRLTKEYGKGFNQSNVWNMRQFYKIFPILHALRKELSWTHYRHLMRVEKDHVQEFYMNPERTTSHIS